MSNAAVDALKIEFAALKERVEGLYAWQKWQMVVLGGILIAVVTKRF